MDNRFLRTATLIGEAAVNKLSNSAVAVFGIGGVGSYVCEALARAGVGKLILIDSDKVDITNINRQIIALTSTLGCPKVEVMKARVLDINPSCEVIMYQMLYLPETAENINLTGIDYIADAVDNVTAKLHLVQYAHTNNIKIISAMGTGNKLDPTRFEVADVFETSQCPLARILRTELRKRAVSALKVVYSKETPVLRERVPASVSFVPSSAGLIMASEIVKDLCQEKSV